MIEELKQNINAMVFTSTEEANGLVKKLVDTLLDINLESKDAYTITITRKDDDVIVMFTKTKVPQFEDGMGEVIFDASKKG